MGDLKFKPYQYETDSIQLADLTVENRLDRLSIYGSITLTKDKDGLDMALALEKIIDLPEAELVQIDLPDRIAAAAPVTSKTRLSEMRAFPAIVDRPRRHQDRGDSACAGRPPEKKGTMPYSAPKRN
jgi:hypothetical protein